jgi:aquaporin Z
VNGAAPSPPRGGRPRAAARLPWPALACEAAGTALLVACGVSLVIADFGAGSPVAAALPSDALRRVVTGFGFGCVGALIAVSGLGKVSGAHINPVVTLAFWRKGAIGGRHALAYVVAQLAGGVLGGLPLLAWGRIGESVGYGVTVPGAGTGVWVAVLGEAVTTATLVLGLFAFLGSPRLRRFTPLLFPFLYAVMVGLEAPLSGTSTNPARSLGPAVVAGVWTGWWVYVVGPLAGALAATGLHGRTWLRRFEIGVAKLYHFDHDPRRILHAPQRPPAPGPSGGAAV